MDARAQHGRRGEVAQIMDADPGRQSSPRERELEESVGVAARHGRADLSAEHQAVVGVVRASSKALDGLVAFPSAQAVDRDSRERDGAARAVRLGLSVD